jgi:DUF971 family protein
VSVPLELPDAEAPIAVELDRAAALTVEWADGTRRRFELADLRRNCPCAECRGLREQGRTPGPGPDRAPTAVGAELVGGWGITITWDDGHSTGIYAWSILRMWEVPDD